MRRAPGSPAFHFERGLQPCGYGASVIDERLGEVNQRLRDLRIRAG
ncbi:MAG: hypothetical protein M3071_13570 [Actinomycetota bacterium]|nr:hypothetical protein [Actinomycetota bacterium]